MDPPTTHERAWAELAQIDAFAAANQPLEALARARWLERRLDGYASSSDPTLEAIHALARERRKQLESEVERWERDAERRQRTYLDREHAAVAPPRSEPDDETSDE